MIDLLSLATPILSNSLLSLLEQSGQAVFIKDLTGTYHYMSAAGADMIGRTVLEVLGHSDETLFDAESAAVMRRRENIILTQDQPLNYRSEVNTIGGTPMVFESTKIPLRDSTGTIRGIIGMARNISREPALLALPQSGWGELRHGLRNDLTPLKLRVQLLARLGEQAASGSLTAATHLKILAKECVSDLEKVNIAIDSIGLDRRSP